MEIALFLAGVATLAACAAWLRLARARDCILAHPHVAPLAEALPVHAPLVADLTKELADIAGVPAPDIYVYRAALPNAFVSIRHLRPEMFLADELFEQVNHDQGRAVLELADTIAHELAHVKLHQTLAHAIFWWMKSSNIGTGIASVALRRIEREADVEAEKVMQVFRQRHALAPTTSAPTASV